MKLKIDERYREDKRESNTNRDNRYMRNARRDSVKDDQKKTLGSRKKQCEILRRY